MKKMSSDVNITNNEKSYGRNRRLFRVADYYYVLMETVGYGQDRGGKYESATSLGSTPITGLHDHKGTLTVTWASRPDLHEVRAIEIAWEKAGEESGCTVKHEIESEATDGL